MKDCNHRYNPAGRAKDIIFGYRCIKCGDIKVADCKSVKPSLPTENANNHEISCGSMGGGSEGNKEKLERC